MIALTPGSAQSRGSTSHWIVAKPIERAIASRPGSTAPSGARNRQGSNPPVAVLIAVAARAICSRRRAEWPQVSWPSTMRETFAGSLRRAGISRVLGRAHPHEPAGRRTVALAAGPLRGSATNDVRGRYAARGGVRAPWAAAPPFIFLMARAQSVGPMPVAAFPKGVEVAPYRLGDNDQAVHRLIYTMLRGRRLRGTLSVTLTNGSTRCVAARRRFSLAATSGRLGGLRGACWPAAAVTWTCLLSPSASAIAASGEHCSCTRSPIFSWPAAAT